MRSHAVGAGAPLPAEVVRGMLRAAGRRRCGAGTPACARRSSSCCWRCSSAASCPWCRAKGSVGSSGDLAPLAHVALVLVGEGEAEVDGERLRRRARRWRARASTPVALEPKEGLALINGTHLMAAAGGLAARDARRLLDAAVVALALSLEAFKGSTVPFDERLAGVRPHPGAQRVAARLRALLDGSEVVASHADCGRVQDPYTLRCAPQVLGAIDDALAYIEAALERELHAVTDNPLVFPDGRRRRGRRQLPRPAAVAAARPPRPRRCASWPPSASGAPTRCSPPATPACRAFLSPRPGLSSGLMLTQYAAAALVNECQVLAHPAGAGSIPTSAGQEDFNSMGAFAALKARTVVENCAQVIATELVCACQGLEFHRPLRTTPPLEAAVEKVRALVPRIEEDRVAQRRAGGAGRGAADRGGRAVRCRGWAQEAALLMLENNLHPDVAERPQDLVVYGGIGKAARDHASLRDDQARAAAPRRRRDAARAVGQAGGRVRDPPATRRAC